MASISWFSVDKVFLAVGEVTPYRPAGEAEFVKICPFTTMIAIGIP